MHTTQLFPIEVASC